MVEQYNQYFFLLDKTVSFNFEREKNIYLFHGNHKDLNHIF